MDDMRVDVIIAVYRPDTCFYNCIKRILKQTVEVGKIILVCPQECASDINMISDKMEVHSFSGKNPAVSEMKNYGASRSDADIIVFMDPEAKAYNKYTLENLIRPLKKAEINASYARTLARGDCNEPERFDLICYYPSTSFVLTSDKGDPGSKLSPLGYGCAAYIKGAFDKVDGYDRSFYSEDCLLALEILESGSDIAYCSDAVVVASHNISPIMQFKRYFDIGLFQQQALSRFGYGFDSRTETRRGVKGAMYLLDYKEYLWMGYNVFYKGAKYLGYIFGTCCSVLPNKIKYYMSSHPEQFLV